MFPKVWPASERWSWWWWYKVIKLWQMGQLLQWRLSNAWWILCSWQSANLANHCNQSQSANNGEIYHKNQPQFVNIWRNILAPISICICAWSVGNVWAKIHLFGEIKKGVFCYATSDLSKIFLKLRSIMQLCYTWTSLQLFCWAN